jgi:hypothetical protein
MLKKLLHGARSHYPLSIAVLLTVFLLLGVIALTEKASRESDARKNPLIPAGLEVFEGLPS